MKFQPGQSGNPAGRPKKEAALTDILRNTISSMQIDTANGKIEAKKALAMKILQIALSGDITAIRYIYDRIDGRPVETVNQTIKEIPEYVGFIDSRNTEDSDAD